MLFEQVSDSRHRVERRDGRGDLDRHAGQPGRSRDDAHRDPGEVGAELYDAPVQAGFAGMIVASADRVVGRDVVLGLDRGDRAHEVVETDALLVERDHDACEDGVHLRPVHALDRVQRILGGGPHMTCACPRQQTRANLRGQHRCCRTPHGVE